MSKKVPRPRVSHQQREAMLAYMMAHEDLARGRVSGADAMRHKTNLLEKLAKTLNAIGSGATKTPDKWLKCWMDWRCDVKAKALRLKKRYGSTGGGPGSSSLTQMEKTLLEFCGREMVLEVEVDPNPLEVTDMSSSTEASKEPAFEEEIKREEQEWHHKTNNDLLQDSLQRQATALEQIAGGLAELASSMKTGLQEVASALRTVASAVQQHTVVVAMPEND